MPRTNNIPMNESDHQIEALKAKFETFVLDKLQEYSTKRTTMLLFSPSAERIRRRLRRDSKSFLKQFKFQTISETILYKWIDEMLEKIQSNIHELRSIYQLHNDVDKIISAQKHFSFKSTTNKWRQLQLKRAKIVLPDVTYENDNELLSKYQKYVIDTLTPKQLKHNQIPLKDKKRIDLNEEFRKSEEFATKYLTKLLAKYKQRKYPNIKLVKQMVELGMKHMIKQPRSDEFCQVSMSSNILTKAMFIVKSKQSYAMSLRNIADDFMLLRFGHSVDLKTDDNTSVRKRFMNYIHMFLNTISLLIYLFNSKASDPSLPLLTYNALDSNLTKECILSPAVYVDEWTWLLEKWRMVLETVPISFTNQGAFSRLVRTTIGIGIARLFGFIANNEHDELDKNVFQALQMGFFYGVAYALVDGLQDNQSNENGNIDVDKWLEKVESILCGDELDSSTLPQLPITPLLLETFHSLVQLTSKNSIMEPTFTDLALLLHSQRIDKKDLNNQNYSDIDLFLGPFLKSHYTYTATAFLGGAKNDVDHQHLWMTPFLGQLTDDCRDFNEDYQTKSITPVTYYAEHRGRSFNPFFMFLLVCEDLFIQSGHQENTGAFLGRRILRTLRSLGDDFKKFLNIFTAESYPDLHQYLISLEKIFPDISDPEKSAFRYVNTFGKNYALNHRKLQTFVFDYLPLIEKQLPIKTNDNNLLVRGMNYSLKAGGKRLRPLLLLMIALIYNIDVKRILPLARAIEYLHTSSLIFDDLPAQDNAPLRRGRPTLHMTIDGDQNDIPPSLAEGRAQLAAVDLIAYAIQSVTIELSKENFSYEAINLVTSEVAQSMSELCYGQFLDLQYSKISKPRTIDELDQVAYLKTGKAIEVAVVCPAILAGQNEQQHLTSLRQLSRLMGILFQMKDDLLDVEGDVNDLGKQNNIDQKNKTVTYISVLGVKNTKDRLKNIRQQVDAILDHLWPHVGTVQDLVGFICERKS